LALAVVSATKRLKNGDKWKEGPAMIHNHVFHRIYMFTPDRRRASVKVL